MLVMVMVETNSLVVGDDVFYAAVNGGNEQVADDTVCTGTNISRSVNLISTTF